MLKRIGSHVVVKTGFTVLGGLLGSLLGPLGIAIGALIGGITGDTISTLIDKKVFNPKDFYTASLKNFHSNVNTPL